MTALTPTARLQRTATNSLTMSHRSLRMTWRDQDATVGGLIMPTIVLLLFTFVFGGAMEVGGDYVDFLYSGVLVWGVVNGAYFAAGGVHADLSRGVVDRFRSMAISPSSLLTGHVVATLMRTLVASAMMTAVAFLIGFRPVADGGNWLLLLGKVVAFTAALAWSAVAIGLAVRSTESAYTAATFLTIVSMLSGFAPVDSMPTALRVIVEHLPTTPVVVGLRNLVTTGAVTTPLWQGLAWSIGIAVAMHALSLRLFRRRAAR